MNPKIGRPKSDNPKNVDIKVRVDEGTNNKLIAYAKKYRLTRTDVIRKGINWVLTSDEKK